MTFKHMHISIPFDNYLNNLGSRLTSSLWPLPLQRFAIAKLSNPFQRHVLGHQYGINQDYPLRFVVSVLCVHRNAFAFSAQPVWYI